VSDPVFVLPVLEGALLVLVEVDDAWLVDAVLDEIDDPPVLDEPALNAEID